MLGFVDPVTAITRNPSTRHKHMLTSCDSRIWENTELQLRPKQTPLEKKTENDFGF